MKLESGAAHSIERKLVSVFELGKEKHGMIVGVLYFMATCDFAISCFRDVG